MTVSEARRQRKIIERLQKKAAFEEPLMEFEFGTAGLLYEGPVIVTDLTLTAAHSGAILQAGRVPPPPVRCRFLIDTGADGTVVKHEIAEAAGLKLINSNAPMSGVGIDTTGRMYMGRILFGTPSRKYTGINHRIFVDTQIASGTLGDPEHIDGLIGRDVLHYFDMRYSGPTGKVVMRFKRPASLKGTPGIR